MRGTLVWLGCLGVAFGQTGEQRWNAAYTEHYPSRAEGRSVPFRVETPPQRPEIQAYPLIVELKGSLRIKSAPTVAPFIKVRPTRGGIWGYRSLSTFDVMQVVAFMMEHYPVDPDRIYLVGSSAGASGAMHVASCYPDQFAGVLAMVAAGNDYPIANFTHLPVAIHHGDRDWTSAICDARVQTQRFRAAGCPVILKEHAGAGHSVPRPHEPILTWLLSQKRNPSPTTITHDCETPSLGRSYWLKIDEFFDPHRRARVSASVRVDGGRRFVTIRPENVARLTLDSTLIPHPEAGDPVFELPGFDQPVLEQKAGKLRINLAPASAESPFRPYEAGAAANLYQGEPLLIVYGTETGDPARRAQLRTAAENLAHCGGPSHARLSQPLPLLADRDVTPKQEANANLILLGRPDENRVARSMLPDLPLSLPGETLNVAGRPPLPLQGRVLSLLHPHPAYPDRLIYILAPFTNDREMAHFARAPQSFLAGSDGFDRVSQADLLVQDLDGRIARQMQFGKDWSWLQFPGAGRLIPNRFRERSALAQTYMQVMRSTSEADYALWWGPADGGMWGVDFNYLRSYDPEHYTWADFQTQHRLSETMTGGVTGAEFRKIWRRWGGNEELLFVPEPDFDTISDGAEIRLHLPMDLYIKLGRRQRNLAHPKPGPPASAEEVGRSIFAAP